MKKATFALAFALVLGLSGLVSAADGYNPDLVPNRLSFARTGEWASYKLPNGYIQKLTVDRRFGEGEDAILTIRVDNIYDGKVVETKEITETAGEAFTAPRVPSEDGITVALRQATSELGGKTVAASVVEINKYSSDPEDCVDTEWWTSADVPVFGILKKMTNGEVEWELEDFGTEPEKEEAKK